MNIDINPNQVNVNANPPRVGVSSGTPVARDYVDRPAYDGPYSVTPTESAQTLQTKHFRMTDNIVVNPIPSNYGLITWNGSIITVS